MTEARTRGTPARLKKFIICRKNDGDLKVVKNGFSWPAFFLAPFWCFYKGMIAEGFGLLALVVCLELLCGLFPPGSGAGGFLYFLNFCKLLVATLMGCQGNKWYRQHLINSGYRYACKIKAMSEMGACKLFRSKDQDRRAEAAKILAQKTGGGAESGIDPAIVIDLAMVASYYIEEGTHTYSEISEIIADRLEKKAALYASRMREIYEMGFKLSGVDISDMDLPDGTPAAKAKARAEKASAFLQAFGIGQPPKMKTAKIKCPSCGQEYMLEVGAAATTYRCAVCKAEFTAELIEEEQPEVQELILDTPANWRAMFGTPKQQAVAFWIALAFLVGSLLYPPWYHYNPHARGYSAEHPNGWHFIFDTDQGEDQSAIAKQIDYGRLVFQDAIILSIIGGMARAAAKLRLRPSRTALFILAPPVLILVTIIEIYGAHLYPKTAPSRTNYNDAGGSKQKRSSYREPNLDL